MPDPRRIHRRLAASAVLGRLTTHLVVLLLLGAATFVGSSASTERGSAWTGLLTLVSTARGAADVSATVAPSRLQALPAEEVALLNRGGTGRAAGVAAEPLPTPIPLDPNATALAAPGGVTLGVTVDVPTSRGATSGRAIGLVWPVPGGSLTQGFHAGHRALDIANAYGAPVVAARAGVVVTAGWRNNGGGYVIEIDHGNGMRTIYNHLGVIEVGIGQSVYAGERIAANGCSGLCTGPHVHFEVAVDGVMVDPRRFF